MEMTLFWDFAIQQLGGLRMSKDQSRSITTSGTFWTLLGAKVGLDEGNQALLVKPSTSFAEGNQGLG